jgi:hypothetical protein
MEQQIEAPVLGLGEVNEVRLVRADLIFEEGLDGTLGRARTSTIAASASGVSGRQRSG